MSSINTGSVHISREEAAKRVSVAVNQLDSYEDRKFLFSDRYHGRSSTAKRRSEQNTPALMPRDHQARVSKVSKMSKYSSTYQPETDLHYEDATGIGMNYLL